MNKFNGDDGLKYSVLETTVAQLLNLPIWDAKKGIGSFLTFEIGLPRQIIREPKISIVEASTKAEKQLSRRVVSIIGEWTLWIYCCNWSIFNEDEVVAHSESSDEDIQLAVVNLSGQMLQKVDVNPFEGTSEFYFDLGGKLSTSPIESKDEQWMLYSNRINRLFTYRGDGYYSDEVADKSESEVVWLPFIGDH